MKEKLKNSPDQVLTEELKREYARWETIFNNGCSDPFWSDGVNLELVRSHIIHDKRQIEEELIPEEYPEEYYRELPPEVSRDYMAKPEEIRRTAKEAYKEATGSDDYSWLFQHLEDERYSNMIRNQARNEIRYIAGIKQAIDMDDLVWMRRAGNKSYHLENLKRIRAGFEKEEKDRSKKDIRIGQLSIFDFI